MAAVNRKPPHTYHVPHPQETAIQALSEQIVLAGELYCASGNYREAFARYESILGSFIAGSH